MKWENLNNSLFADPLEFDENKTQTNTLSTPAFLRKKNGKSSQLGTGRNDIRSADQEENPPFNGNNNNIKSALILVSDHTNSLPRQSIRNYTIRVLQPGQIAYGSELLPKVDTKAPEVGQLSSSANFLSLYMAKSYKYMV